MGKKRKKQEASEIAEKSESIGSSSSSVLWPLFRPPQGPIFDAPTAESIRKEHLFDKVLTRGEVAALCHLEIPREDAERHLPLDAASKEKGVVLVFEDPMGQLWRFRYSYGTSIRSYAMTNEWCRFVRTKLLKAGDTVSFYRGDAVAEPGRQGHRLFIDWNRRKPNLDLTAHPGLRFQEQPHNDPSGLVVLKSPPSVFRLDLQLAMLNLASTDPFSVDPASVRRLLQVLVTFRTTISCPNSALLSDVGLNAEHEVVKHSLSNSQQYLQDLHYNTILAMLLRIGRNHNNAVPRPPPPASETTPIGIGSSQLPSRPTDVVHHIPVAHGKLESSRHLSCELVAAACLNSHKLSSLGPLVMDCILLCRRILGILERFNMEAETQQLRPLYAFDDLACIGQDKLIRMDTRRISATCVADPIYLFPSATAMTSLLYLDLTGSGGVTELPASLGTLHNLITLNLSCCYSLQTLPASLGSLQNLLILLISCCRKLQNLPLSLGELSNLRLLDSSGCSSLEILPPSFVYLGHLENLNLANCTRLRELPQPFGHLQNLKYLNLSGCHKVDLDVEHLCKLVNLRCLTLSPHKDFQPFPDSFQYLANHLDMLRWWKKNWVHPQCNPKPALLHSYRCYRESIIDWLLSDSSYDQDYICSDQIATSICIVGESGMGKTELVRQIYSDQMISEAFDLRIWVYTSNQKRLLGKIIEFAGCTYFSDAPMSILEEIVIEELTGKRFLLVLDDSDSNSQSFWSYVQKLLDVGAKGSAFIVTTKSKEVADLVGAMQTCYLSSLHKEECFTIFKGHVLGSLDVHNYPHIEIVGQKVFEKCGGNPLCIKALSGLLCHSEIALSEIGMLVDGTQPVLKLCYDLLPIHLQQCFKFCSLFPKNYIFIKHHIVRLWIAQGYVFPEEDANLEDTGLHYFDELLCRSFFQHSPFGNDQEDKFVMHELFHALAHTVSQNKCFRSEEPFCSVPQNISHLSLVPSNFKTVALAKEVRDLQSFLVVRRSFPLVRILLLDDFYLKNRFLKALDLSNTDIVELPISIGNMKHLHLLALNKTKIKGLPFEIGQVDTLQTLELKDCSDLIELPGSLKNLVNLRHLDVCKEPGSVQTAMPHGIGQLTDLQTLTVFNVGNDFLHCSIGELKNLNRLRGHINVTCLENIKTANNAREANIVRKHLLEALTLEWSYRDEDIDGELGKEICYEILENLQPNSNLQELVIRNYPGKLFPVWMQDNYLCKIISITLDNCHDCSELPHYLGALPFLKYLYVQRMNTVQSFGLEGNSLAVEGNHFCKFPSLEVLTLREMYGLQFLVGTSNGHFPRLCRLSISRCPNLTNLPPLVSLVHLSFHCGGQVPSFSELRSLESLKIAGFHKVQSISFPHQMTMLKKLEISDCKELSSMLAYYLSISDLKVVRCLKLDLIGSLLEDHLRQKVVGGRNIAIRRPAVLKTVTCTNLQDDLWKWEKYGEKSMSGSKFSRLYYRCIDRNSTGCMATKILQPNDTDPNLWSVMYIFKHNHKFSNELHLEQCTQLGTIHERKESDISKDENMLKRQKANDFSG